MDTVLSTANYLWSLVDAGVFSSFVELPPVCMLHLMVAIPNGVWVSELVGVILEIPMGWDWLLALSLHFGLENCLLLCCCSPSSSCFEWSSFSPILYPCLCSMLGWCRHHVLIAHMYWCLVVIKSCSWSSAWFHHAPYLHHVLIAHMYW